MSPTESTWLTLSHASELLGVHPTTLRAWVKAGKVQAYLTPGGHRRFQLGELRAFLEHRRADVQTQALMVAPDQALAQVRLQMQSEQIAGQAWFRRMTDAEREKHRGIGQRLLGLLLQFVSRQENSEPFLLEARELAREYGHGFATAHASVGDLAQAFLLFRRMILSATYFAQRKTIADDEEGSRLLQRITYFMDDLMIATLDAYVQPPRPVTLSPQAPTAPKRRSAKRKSARR